MKAISFKCLLILLLGSLSILRADSFDQGLASYEASDFPSAIEHFQLSVEHSETAATRHNLALSFFQAGQKAEAAWQLERAIRINPFKDDYRFKSEALREHLGLMPQRPRWYNLFAEALTQSQWAVVGTIGFWVALLSIILPVAGRQASGLAIKTIRVLGLVAIILSVPAYTLQLRLGKQGVVISEEPLSLHAAPAMATPETGTARPGERGRVLDQHGNYYRIETEGQATGWISIDSFRPIIDPKTDA